MNRLQKKCLVASMAMHSLLLLVLLVGPAFLWSKKVPDDLPVLDVIPSRLTDALFSGGGNPNAKTPPASAITQPVQQPQLPAPQPPQSEPVIPKARTESKPPPETKPAKPVPTPVVVKAETPTLSTEKLKPQIKISEKITTRTTKDLAEDTAQREKEEARARERELAAARQRAGKQIEARLSGSLKSLSENLSSGTTIEMPGTGGGEAYANYGQVIKSIYDHAWMDPDEVNDDAATVKVKVVVARDGTIISDLITGRSGVPALDKSVQRALERVRQLPPFPEGTKDRERIFIINFNLKAKRLIG
jgi:TonB family protein